MLKQIFILTGFLCLFFTMPLYGLDRNIEFKDVRGRWLVVDIERQDGSCILTCTGIPKNTRIEYFFKNKTDLVITNLQTLNSITHKTNLDRDRIDLNYPSRSYDIKRMGDTLVLLEMIEGKNKDELEKIRLVRRADVMKKYNSEYIGDTLVTDVYTHPLIYKGFMTYLWEKVHVYRKHVFFIEGYLIINRKEETVHTVFTSKGEMSEQIERKFRKAMAKSYKEWTFVENAPVYKIPFYGELKPSTHGKYGELNFGKEQEVKLQHKPLESSCDDQLLSDKKFNRGLIAFKKKNYKQAIELFKEANNLNPMKIDALYNVASIYLILEQVEKACPIWSYLSDELKQMPARSLLEEHCK